MATRLLVCLTALLFAVLPGTALAQDQASVLEMKRLEVLLSIINAELKSELEQILVLQEAMKANSRRLLEAQGLSPDPVLYEDQAAAQRQAIQREAAINAQFDAIVARSVALSAKKQLILDRIMELGGVR